MFEVSKQITVLEHPPCSLDLAGRHFDDIDYIRSNTVAALKSIPQNHF
jgi:hypothetical protein